MSTMDRFRKFYGEKIGVDVSDMHPAPLTRNDELICEFAESEVRLALAPKQQSSTLADQFDAWIADQFDAWIADQFDAWIATRQRGLVIVELPSPRELAVAFAEHVIAPRQQSAELEELRKLAPKLGQSLCEDGCEECDPLRKILRLS